MTPGRPLANSAPAAWNHLMPLSPRSCQIVSSCALVGAEIGHLRVVPNGLPCGCGARGCIEQYGSGRALLRMANEIADAGGIVTFSTIFPGCYDGRMPHVHFEVYPSLAKATSAANRIKTSQFGFPTATLAEAYTASGYSASVRNLAKISYATDNVFSDGTSLQIVSVTGNATQGFVASLTVGVSL